MKKVISILAIVMLVFVGCTNKEKNPEDNNIQTDDVSSNSSEPEESFDTVTEFVSRYFTKDALDATNEEMQGLNLDIKGTDNEILYIYTYEGEIDNKTEFAKIDKEVKESKDALQDAVNAIKDKVKQDTIKLKLQYLDINGEEVFSYEIDSNI